MQLVRSSQAEKAKVFSDLHQKGECFVIPNPWDAGSAKILTDLGFKALASTSAGLAFSHGKADSTISREVHLEYLKAVCDATHLPISADLEGGFGIEPEIVKETIRMAAACGVVGGSIEDSTTDPDRPVLNLGLSAERIRAAVQVSRSFDFPFLLTARAENYFVGINDLPDTIARLQAYEDAGADVLFAPGLKEKSDIALVLREIKTPLNVLIGFPGMDLGVSELKDMGVTRISVGGSLARSAIATLYRGAKELLEKGTSEYSREATPSKQLNLLFRQK